MNDVGLLLAVSTAGGAGSALRYLTDKAIPARARARYPWGTNAVNVIGSFALGLLTGTTVFHDSWQSILGTGLIGGYTTFSTASLETVCLIGGRRRLAATANGLGMLIVCVLAAIAGVTITRS